jgi:hypothetical protein
MGGADVRLPDEVPVVVEPVDDHGVVGGLTAPVGDLVVEAVRRARVAVVVLELVAVVALSPSSRRSFLSFASFPPEIST